MNSTMTALWRRLSAPGWGVFLVPIALMSFGLWGRTPHTTALVVMAAIVVLFAPAVAADLVSLTLIMLGLYGLFMAAFFNSIATPIDNNFTYGAVEVATAWPHPWRDYLIAPQAVLFLVAGLWLVPRTLGVHLRQSRSAAGLARRVEQLRETRANAVDSAAAELRRVERDLHDGAQARLVAVGMNLRAAERLIAASPETALVLVGEAREMSARALTELRDLVRGIHPPVLADRGLGDAIRALALETPVTTRLDIDLPGRLPAPVESAAYFAVAEILANAVKHAQAGVVEIQLQHHRGVLRITVTDDGAGGADPEKGSGLRGVERRLGAFDGILAVNSPPGGPTIVVIEVPCASSSLKTSSC